MDKESCRKLIKLYGTKELLWNSKSSLYHNKTLRKDAWREIGCEMGVEPVSELKKKMTVLLSSYRREKSRISKSQISGSGRDIYVSKWFGFNDFSFMQDKCTPNDTTDTSQACTSKQNTNADEHQREEQVTRRRYPHTNTKAQKRWTDSTSDLHEVQENMANAITVINRLIKDQHKQNDIEEDEVELYGKLLVKRLRMLSQKECQELMYEIDGIVLNRLHNERDPMSFNNGDSVSSPPGSPIVVYTVKRSLSPCSPYTTPAASPGSP